MNILGISAFVHDSAATLVKDGKLIANVEEERLNREKHTSCFPKRAIEFVLNEGDISLDDVDVIAFNWDPVQSLISELLKLLVLPLYIKIFKHNKPPKNIKSIFATFLLRRYLKKEIAGAFRGKLIWVPHHKAHAASSYYLSSFEDADILVLDGHGEHSSATFYTAQNKEIQAEWSLPIRHSLGIIYSNFTYFLGFGEWEEGKTMALASYGKNSYRELFENVIKLLPNGKIEVDHTYLGLWNYKNGKLQEELGPWRKNGSPIEQRHKDIARSMQERVKDAVLHMLRHTSKNSSTENCCMAGGLFLNCDINREIQQSGLYKNYFIPPFTSDTGGAAGAALFAAFSLFDEPLDRKELPFSPYTGPGYAQEEIRQLLENRNLAYTESDVPWKEAASALQEQKLIGWFQGRAEAGPRALGNRSIIAAAGSEDIRDLLNTRIKKRESFRPFAPVVLEEEVNRCFDISAPIPAISRYMLLTCIVKEEFREQLAGITHIDGTARIQVVNPEWSPELTNLLKELKLLTGIGIAVNTSFNRHEPVVCSPEDAVNTFLKTGLDMLVLGNFVLRKDMAGLSNEYDSSR